MIRASNLYQAKLCPGSVAAQDGLPESAPDEISLRGTRIHAAMNGDTAALAECTDDDVAAMEKTVQKREQLSAEFGKGMQVLAVINEGSFTGLVSGHPDTVILLRDDASTEKALIWDTKTGWKEQTEPAQNLQLRCYAHLVFRAYKEVMEIVAGLVPSNFKVPLPCVYTRADVPAIVEEIVGIIEEADKPDAPRNPSLDACRYCRAKATARCPETQRLPAVFNQPLNIATLRPEDWSNLLDVCSMAEDRIKSIKAKAKELVQADANAIPGYGFKPGAKMPEIADAQKVFAAVQDVISPEDFGMKCCDVSVTKLRRVYGDARKFKVKDHKTELDNVLGPLITYTPKAASLVRLTPALPQPAEQ